MIVTVTVSMTLGSVLSPQSDTRIETASSQAYFARSRVTVPASEQLPGYGRAGSPMMLYISK